MDKWNIKYGSIYQNIIIKIKMTINNKYIVLECWLTLNNIK